MSADFDFLVLGSGLAGQNAALRLAEHGRVLLVTKRALRDNATAWAQGGFAAVVDPADSLEHHAEDTKKAGAGLCDADAVNSIIGDGPRSVERLIELGVRFDLMPDGQFDLTREGGHSERRILHVKDATGREIDRALREATQRHENITLWTDHIAIDLITRRKLGRPDDRCLGAYILDTEAGAIRTVRAGAVLLATGGAGKVYLYTSNPDVATGDGVAMAFRAGATMANMEFMQFHPTCLYHPHAKSFLVSEALRGEGGILRLSDGAAFMQGEHDMADLAPRDIVARAIDRNMKRSGDDCVSLDMTHLDPAFIASHFPNIHTACLALGIDMTRNPIPVVPAAHYACGGVATDLSARTSVPGLWAAGETAYTGLHGANRLASNSLLEAAVMSERAAADMADNSEVELDLPVPEWDAGSAVDTDEAVVVSHNWDELRRLMWNYVGIVRSDKRLRRATDRVDLLREEIREYYWDFKVTSDLLELRNLITVAQLTVASAQRRRESRGLHFNLDTPDTAESLAVPTRFTRGRRGSIVWQD